MPKTLVQSITRQAGAVTSLIERWLAPLFDLGLRLYLGQIFWRAGWLKITDWSATLDLFDYVYQVPLLPPHLAAVFGTAGELGLPILLVLGFAGRFAAAGLFVVNLIAAISFPDISDLGLQDHWLWGSLLLVLATHGPGRFALTGCLGRGKSSEKISDQLDRDSSSNPSKS